MDASAIKDLRMPITYGQHLLRLFDAGKLFEGTGLTAAELEDPNYRISVRQLLRYANNALDLGPEPDWHLAWASTLSDHFHGPISAAMLSAPTLGHGLDTFLQYFPSRIPYMHMQGYSRGDNFVAELSPLIDLGRVKQLLIETPLILLKEHLATVYPVRFAEATVEFAYPATPYADLYPRYFNCSVKFGASNNALIVPLSWRRLINLGHSESTWVHAVSQCESTAGSSRERSTLGQIRIYLCEAFERAERLRKLPSLDQVAVYLHITPRTLTRRLQKLGTNYQRLTDEFLQARAQELLANDKITIKEVSSELGFDNPANFGKAFKRWVGVSPGSYRSGRVRNL
jgi:AraC-like DNA-binding protein